MTTTRNILIGAGLAAAVLTGCSSHEDARYVAVCHDRITDGYLPDYMCDSPSGIYPNAGSYYMPWNTWHETVEVNHHHYYTGERLTGGTTTRPSSRNGAVRVQSASNPAKVTLYSKGKQAGVPIKMNQDAKKVGTVTKSQKQSYNSSFKSSGGYTAKKTNSISSSSNKPSTSRRK